jgi:hypothetical protein
MKTSFFLTSICTLAFTFVEAYQSTPPKTPLLSPSKQIENKIPTSHENRLYFGPYAQNTELDTHSIGIYHGPGVGGFMGYRYTQPMALFAQAYITGDWSWLSRGANSSTINMTSLSANTNIGFTGSFGDKKQYTLAPYSGYAYRYIQQQEKIVGFNTYYITFKKPLIPLGFLFTTQINSFLSSGLNYECQFDIDPMAKINYMKGSFWKLKKTIDQMISANVNFKIADSWDIKVSPYYNSIRTGKSTATSASGTVLGIKRETIQMYGGSCVISYIF